MWIFENVEKGLKRLIVSFNRVKDCVIIIRFYMMYFLVLYKDICIVRKCFKNLLKILIFDFLIR